MAHTSPRTGFCSLLVVGYLNALKTLYLLLYYVFMSLSGITLPEHPIPSYCDIISDLYEDCSHTPFINGLAMV